MNAARVDGWRAEIEWLTARRDRTQDARTRSALSSRIRILEQRVAREVRDGT
jgi:hypothetical protein